jgi:hypothetical protein
MSPETIGTDEKLREQVAAPGWRAPVSPRARAGPDLQCSAIYVSDCMAGIVGTSQGGPAPDRAGPLVVVAHVTRACLESWAVIMRCMRLGEIMIADGKGGQN